MDNNTLLSQLTVGEFLEIQRKQFLLFSEKNVKYEYGLKGLAKILGCSRATASKIKSTGILNDAIYQNGTNKSIVINKEKALELFRKKRK